MASRARSIPRLSKRHRGFARQASRRPSSLGSFGLLPPEIRNMVYNEYYAVLSRDYTSTGYCGCLLSVNTAMRAEAKGALHSFLLRSLIMGLELSSMSQTSAPAHDFLNVAHCKLDQDTMIGIEHYFDYFEDSPFDEPIYDLSTRYPKPMDAFHLVQRLTLHVQAFDATDVEWREKRGKRQDITGDFTWSQVVQSLAGLRELVISFRTGRVGTNGIAAIDYTVRKTLSDLVTCPKLHKVELYFYNLTFEVKRSSSFLKDFQAIFKVMLNASGTRWEPDASATIRPGEVDAKLLVVFKKVSNLPTE